MLDCGMHMGFNDERRFPDFSFISKEGPLDAYVHCVIISHFHLDHCGSLPYMTEMVGYSGPLYMTHPTKAIAPVLLEDYRKIQVNYKGDTNFFTSEMIKTCMKKVTAVNLHETVQVDNNFEIKAYYAGHVLGAAMFHIRVGSESIVYTGDYNMTPDRHLGAAQIDRCCPDVLISESTYATTIRDSKRARERDFLKKVHDCVQHGGKVLIPVFALGRAQELCILLESYWERMNLQYPIYFTLGLTEKANNYYKLFIGWTNEKIKRTFVERNMFDFKHIQPFEKQYMDAPGPMVVFATPGMLHSGTSLRIFKRWCSNAKNMVIMPGYCVAGTVGHQIINGAKRIMDGNREIEVNISVQYMSFSAHADAKGIMQLVRNCQPKHVIFVHGEKLKMEFLAEKVKKEFRIPVFCPANGETISCDTQPEIIIDASLDLLRSSMDLDPCPSKRICPFRGTLVLESEDPIRAVTLTEAFRQLPHLQPHSIQFTVCVKRTFDLPIAGLADRLATYLQEELERSDVKLSFEVSGGCVNLGSTVSIRICDESKADEGVLLQVSWELKVNPAVGTGLRIKKCTEHTTNI